MYIDHQSHLLRVFSPCSTKFSEFRSKAEDFLFLTLLNQKKQELFVNHTVQHAEEVGKVLGEVIHSYFIEERTYILFIVLALGINPPNINLLFYNSLFLLTNCYIDIRKLRKHLTSIDENLHQCIDKPEIKQIFPTAELVL